MTEPYTPTTEDVRAIFAAQWMDYAEPRPESEFQAEFDRWLERHDAEISAAALEALPYAFTGAWKGRNGPTIAQAIEYIRARATEYRDEAEA